MEMFVKKQCNVLLKTLHCFYKNIPVFLEKLQHEFLGSIYLKISDLCFFYSFRFSLKANLY